MSMKRITVSKLLQANRLQRLALAWQVLSIEHLRRTRSEPNYHHFEYLRRYTPPFVGMHYLNTNQMTSTTFNMLWPLYLTVISF